MIPGEDRTSPRFMRFHIGMKRTIRALLAVRKNMAKFLPLYHRCNAYLFNRRYRKGLAPWREISGALFHWLSKLREEAVGLAPHGRILEIGCGDGALTARLSRDSREVIGSDISVEAIKRAKKHEGEHLTFSVHNIERDPLVGDNSLIICEDVLYSVPFVSMKKVKGKLSEALMHGGILLVIDYLPEDMETRYCYQMLSRFLTPVRIGPVTYESENVRFMMALYRKTPEGNVVP